MTNQEGSIVVDPTVIHQEEESTILHQVVPSWEQAAYKDLQADSQAVVAILVGLVDYGYRDMADRNVVEEFLEEVDPT